MLDTVAVIRIAKSEKSYLDKDWQFKPVINFDTLLCEWRVYTMMARHTEKGKCRFTNGCTEVLSVVLYLDATTGRVKSRKTEKRLIPNYE